MSPADLKRFKEILLQEKERILENARIAASGIKDQKIDDLRDEMDFATSEFTQGLDLRLMERERKLFLKIEKSLKKIENGTYGICEECEDDIEIKRLEARPVTELCIRCKEAQERKEKSQVKEY